ncbi:hypothetical protein EG68_03044 [Paragonimus skrjabini miyazakii]|uniref:Uncharacterized protein n=1 Tax=Paragonimus skrjabini miyazakii TaxID=59628 RepID=A0A8S9Z1N3_9TREM|nr:hypothetical protein EG68_03044 [Paragonimus skrjabini miyazakii]
MSFYFETVPVSSALTKCLWKPDTHRIQSPNYSRHSQECHPTPGEELFWRHFIHQAFPACDNNSSILLGPYEIMSVANKKVHGTYHQITLVMTNGDCFQLRFTESLHRSAHQPELNFVRLRSVDCPTNVVECVY